MTPKQREKRKAEIAASIRKARKAGLYDAAEHLTGLIELDNGKDEKDDLREAWMEEALDGVTALKRTWGKVWKVRFHRMSVKVIFKSENYLYLKVPRVQKGGWRGLYIDKYSGPILGSDLFTRLVRKGLVEGLEAFEEKKR